MNTYEPRVVGDQFALLVAGVVDYAIFMLDPTGTIVTWNEGAQRIKGLSLWSAVMSALKPKPNSKAAVIDDFMKNQLKPLSLVEVTNQNRFQIEENFMAFIQKQLEESKINSFVEALSSIEELSSYADQWMEEERAEEE